jgi:two-component system, NtrC family, response regulator PilR
LDAVSVLLIDDEACIRVAMSEYFAGLGYVVDRAGDVDSALSLIAQHRYRVVVTDLRLSRNDRLEGLDLLPVLRRCAPQAACIVLTAHGCADTEAKARREGAGAFLQKPQPLATVAAVVAELLARDVAAESPDRLQIAATGG